MPTSPWKPGFADCLLGTTTAEVKDSRMDSIFLMHDDGHLVEMRPEHYSSESVLQELLAHHPHLLTGGSADDRHLLLISKEQGVPDEEGAADRWSLDHLFVDAQGVPTLVEVKRSTDTRIRREVVGQMLDYAANGVRNWPEGSLRQTFEANAGGAEIAQDLMDEFLPERDSEVFWESVEDNLRAGRLRLVFVADDIPATLRRVIEFLNEQMDRTEVIGVEVKQYVGEGRTTLVPRILGRTTAAMRVKPTSGTYAEDLASADQSVRDADRLLTEWASSTSATTRDTRRAKQFKTSDGEFLFQFYPMWSAIEVPVQRLRDAGRDDLADKVRTAFQALTRENLSERALYIPAHDIVSNWTDLTELAIPALVGALKQIRYADAGQAPQQ